MHHDDDSAAAGRCAMLRFLVVLKSPASTLALCLSPSLAVPWCAKIFQPNPQKSRGSTGHRLERPYTFL